MIGELVSNKADLTLFPLTLTQQRVAVIDFTYSYVDGGIGLLVRSAKPTSTALGFLRPFSWEVNASYESIVGLSTVHGSQHSINYCGPLILLTEHSSFASAGLDMPPCNAHHCHSTSACSCTLVTAW